MYMYMYITGYNSAAAEMHYTQKTTQIVDVRKEQHCNVDLRTTIFASELVSLSVHAS